MVRGCGRGCWLYATWPLTAGSGHRAAGSAAQRREITRQQSLIAFIDLLTIVVVLLIAITVCRHVAVWLCGCVTHTDLCMLRQLTMVVVLVAAHPPTELDQGSAGTTTG